MEIKKYQNIYFIPGTGMNSNSVLVLDEKKLLVDPGLPDNYYLLGVLEELGIAPEEVDIVVNTEPHADHCGGNSMFKNAEVYAGKDAADYISAADPKYTASDLFGLKLQKRKVKPLSDKQEILLGKTKLVVLSTPGHAPGGISLYEPDLKILVCGDVAFKNGVGRTDLPGGDMKKLRKSLEKLVTLDFDVFLPGHGPPGFKVHMIQDFELANMLAPGVRGK